jgi:carboxyl-terminal processing protease
MKNSLLIGALIGTILGTPTLANQASSPTYWQTSGYGYILEIQNDDVKFYDITKHHCLINHQKSNRYSSNNLTITGKEQGQFYWDTLHPVKLSKLEKLPELCLKPVKNSTEKGYQFSAPVVFDIFWHTFSEHYAFSDIKRWNWQEKYNVWRAKINDKTAEAELLVVLDKILANINDGHASVESQDGDRLVYHNAQDSAFNHRIQKEFNEQNKFTSFNDYNTYTLKQSQENTASYFVDTFKAKKLNWNVLLAKLPDNLSYFSIDDMMGFSEEGSISSELIGVDKVMSQALPFLNESKGVIIDLRWNGGGADLIAERFLSYFINEKLHAGSKSAKLSQGFSQPKNILIEPSNNENYLGPIVVLTSKVTASAAESFTLYSHARGNVTFIGENSNGSYSDMLMKALPNGWVLSLSNERYYDLAGNHYEFTGFPVAKNFEYFNAKNLEEGIDPALEEAMSILK